MGWLPRLDVNRYRCSLEKMLAFEYGRVMYVTITIFMNDATVCFDEMVPILPPCDNTARDDPHRYYTIQEYHHGVHGTRSSNKIWRIHQQLSPGV